MEPIALRYHPEGLRDEALVSLWRVTGVRQLEEEQRSRLNNRSWRLMRAHTRQRHERHLTAVMGEGPELCAAAKASEGSNGGIYKFEGSKSSEGDTPDSAGSSHRPSLFSDASTLFSSSKSLAKDSDSDDISDISEDDEYEEDSGAASVAANAASVGAGTPARAPVGAPADQPRAPAPNFYIASSPSPKTGRCRKDSLFGSHGSTSRSASNSLRLQRDPASRNSCSSTDISENDNESAWQSVSSEDEAKEAEPAELVFHKRSVAIPPQRASTDPIPVRPESVSSGPRSLLSGLFLNRMAEKPVLKRASTTDAAVRPSIVFNKRQMAVDVTQPRLSYTDEVSIDNEALPLSKKSSMVGISDFQVVTQPAARSLSARSSSTVNMIREEGRAPEETLSSSLSRYKRSGSALSVNGFLSKSSINLGGLFGHDAAGGSGDARRGYGLFKKREASPKSPPWEAGAGGAGGESNSASGSQSSASGSQSSASGSHLSASGASDRSPEPKFTPRKIMSSKMRSNLSAELSESLKDSIILDFKLGKIPMPEKVIEGVSLGKPIEEEFDDYHSKGW
ncbi:Uncharacterized protein ABC855_g3377 [[Candida] zeylanoides]